MSKLTFTDGVSFDTCQDRIESPGERMGGTLLVVGCFALSTVTKRATR